MKRFRKTLLTLACLGILSSFLALLFVASVGGRSDGREIPFTAGVLAAPGCFVSGCHMTTGGTLNQVGSVSFNNVPASFVPGETYDLGITMAGGSIYGFQVAVVFSDDTQAGALTAVTEGTLVDDIQGVQILTQTSPLVANSVDFQWTAPMEPEEGSVILKVAVQFRQRQLLPDGRRDQHTRGVDSAGREALFRTLRQRRRVVQPDQSPDTGFRGSCQCEAGTVGR